MKQYVWLNPVSVAMYGGDDLIAQLKEKGMEPVECRWNAGGIIWILSVKSTGRP